MPPATPAEAFAKSKNLQRHLAALDPIAVVALLSGLMTDIAYQRHHIRLDWAIRLALTFSRGSKKPKRETLDQVLNEDFDETRVNLLEDPIEDFFIEAVSTFQGDYLIFSGHWEKAASHTENVIDAFYGLIPGEPKDSAIKHVFALLRLSNSLVNRFSYSRRAIGKDPHKRKIDLPFETRLKSYRDRAMFAHAELAELDISVEDLAPFILSEQSASGVAYSGHGDSELEFRPLLQVSGGILIASPGNISTAVRALLIDTAVQGQQRRSLCKGLLTAHSERVRESGFARVEGHIEPVGKACLIQQYFFEESAGRYVHVLLLADGFLDWPQKAFGSTVDQPNAVGDAVIQSIRSAKSFMEKCEGYIEGMTLLLSGGWGGGRSISLDRSGDLATWPIIALEPADAAILGECEDGSLTDFWRMNKQLQLVQSQGFNFHHVNGPLNLFQWWRDTEFALIPPHMLEAVPPLAINFDPNRLLTARKEGAEALDRRSVRRRDGSFVRVTRLDRRTVDDVLHPIYASLEAIRSLQLVGVVLHGDSAWWLSVSKDFAVAGSDLDFETWKAALKWIDLVMPVYLASPFASPDKAPIELRLDIQGHERRDRSPMSDEEIDNSVVLSFDDETRIATVTLKPEWQRSLYRPDNRAEISMTAQLVCGVARIQGVEISFEQAADLVRRVAGSSD